MFVKLLSSRSFVLSSSSHPPLAVGCGHCGARLRIEPWRPLSLPGSRLTLPSWSKCDQWTECCRVRPCIVSRTQAPSRPRRERCGGDLPIVLNLGTFRNILRYSHTINNMIHHGSWQQPFRTSSLHGGS